MPNTTKLSRTEKYLRASMKNMREALPNHSMEDFARLHIETLFGLEREEYLEQIKDDKGKGYYSRSLQSLMKNGIVFKVPRTRTGGFAPLAIELFKMNQEQVNDLVLTLHKKALSPNSPLLHSELSTSI